jgi:hypothetical protein
VNTPAYIIVATATRTEDAFIPCTDEDGEITSVQLADYLAKPSAYRGLVEIAHALPVAQVNLRHTRLCADAWGCAPSRFGIYNLATA